MSYNLKQLVLYLSCLSSILMNGQQKIEDPNLQAAYEAQGTLAVSKADSLFKAVVDNTNASNKDRCKALRELAIISWKHYKNYDRAVDYLDEARRVGDYKFETFLKLMRIERSNDHYKDAMEAIENGIQSATSEADKNYGKYQYCKTLLSQEIHYLNLHNGPINTELLSKASTMLQDLLKINPTNVNVAEVLLGVSLLLNDAKTAMQSWLSYFRFTDDQSAYDYLQTTAKDLSKIMGVWQHRDLNHEEQLELLNLLGASRFYSYVSVLAKRFDIKDQPIMAYATYIERIREITEEYYRLVSIGQSNSGDYLAKLRSENEHLYNLIRLNESEDFSGAAFREAIRSQFGGVFIVSSSSASNQVGLVFGHVVNERIRTVEQYGYKSDFTFTELDMMVSNGYPSWFWEDRGAGGYAVSGGFIRIKPMFNFLAINAWESVTDAVKRHKIEEGITQNLLNSNLHTDIKTIRSELSKKIRLDALDDLYEKLKATGLKDLDLQLKFIEQYELCRDNATMFAHEGRHSIDRVVLGGDYRALGSKRIEYRGRLSQIAFSTSPKLELADMLSGVSQTPTGQSNQMIIDVIETWIKNNRSLVKDYDSNQLPLANLYKLTDQQIISCIQNVDPFYKAHQLKSVTKD